MSAGRETGEIDIRMALSVVDKSKLQLVEIARKMIAEGEVDTLFEFEMMLASAEKRLLGWARVVGAAHTRQLIAISAAAFDEPGADTDPPGAG